MPTNHAVDLRTESGMKLEDVRFSFGVLFSSTRKRSFTEGRGFSIELPAVLDLLDAVAEGGLDASTVREDLLNVVAVLYEEAGCYDYESPEKKLSWCVRDGGCQTCEWQRSSFASYVETMTERWRRWTLPDRFPFAAGSSKGFHTVSCGVVRQRMPDEFPAHDPSDPAALRAFAHTRGRDVYGTSPHDLDQLPGHVGHIPFEPMSDQEARAWMAENTGPKGGRYYKRCQRCAPTP